MFSDLLNRMQSLLQREDIQVILNSVDESQNKHSPSKESSDNQSMETSIEANKDSEKQAEIPSIDFNVSSDDLARHKKELEEESKEHHFTPEKAMEVVQEVKPEEIKKEEAKIEIEFENKVEEKVEEKVEDKKMEPEVKKAVD